MYESDHDVTITKGVRTKYLDRWIYSNTVYTASIARSRYGDYYVDVEQVEIDTEWEPVDWQN